MDLSSIYSNFRECFQPAFPVQQWLLLLTLLAAAYYFIYSQILTRNYPPIPWNLPIIGNLPWIILGLIRSRLPLYEHLRRLSYIYGNVFALNLCGQLVVFINDYKSLKEAFNNPCLCDRQKTYKLNNYGGKRGLAFENGALWAQQRRFTLSTFRSLGVGKTQFEELVTCESKKLVEEITSYKGAMFDPQDLLLSISSNVICHTVFGERYEYHDEELRSLQKLCKRQADLIVRCFPLIFLPILRFVPSKALTEFEANGKTVVKFILNLIQKHHDSFNPDNLRDYTDVYINEMMNNNNGKLAGLDQTSMSLTISSLFSAGTSTTANTLRWCLLWMIRLPEIQTKVQNEMDDVIGRQTLPQMADKHSLHYTRATLLEVQRIASQSRLGVPHASNCETTICGFTIPKGAIIMPNKWAIHHDPELFPDPDIFKPERFLDAEGKYAPRSEVIPFGIGRRVCVGENLAKMELYLFFTHLLHQFTFKGTEPYNRLSEKDPGKDPHDFQLSATRRDSEKG